MEKEIELKKGFSYVLQRKFRNERIVATYIDNNMFYFNIEFNKRRLVSGNLFNIVKQL